MPSKNSMARPKGWLNEENRCLAKQRIVQTLGVHLLEDFLELLRMLNLGGHAVLGENEFAKFSFSSAVHGRLKSLGAVALRIREKNYASTPCIPEN